MRTQGYAITVKLFIPAPKTDFKAQAAAATIMDAIMTDKVLTPELVACATVLDVSGKFGSMDVDEPLSATETAGEEPGGQTQTDETPQVQAA